MTEIGLSEVGRRLHIDRRVLKHLLEQNVIPELSQLKPGRGKPRRLTNTQAQLMAVAAKVHVSGYRGSGLQFLEILTQARRAIRANRSQMQIPLSEGVTLCVDLAILRDQLQSPASSEI